MTRPAPFLLLIVAVAPLSACALAPGAFASEMNINARVHAGEVMKRVPSGRIGTNEDVAGAAICLASRAGDSGKRCRPRVCEC
jgi:NAD(P)-dependent dehydrogenase (short-subunit alcohol dehydrogenase family)